MNAQEMNGWLRYGGGLELWQELYGKFNLVPFAAGNSGVQMAGWFNKEINSIDDLQGLKMRIPGIGGEVLSRAGGVPVVLPGGEIFTALQTGVIDATEWVGPYNDLAFSLHTAAKYYYYPGWHEPGPTLEAFVNKDAWEALPPDLQAMIEVATQAINEDMLSEFTARNNAALDTLINEHGVQLRRLPDDVIAALRASSKEVVAEIAEADPLAKRIYESYMAYLEDVRRYHSISEQAYMNLRESAD
jgi:TRAP-type mannitol/chloroaromatic compound transport system substrate-binding protein